MSLESESNISKQNYHSKQNYLSNVNTAVLPVGGNSVRYHFIGSNSLLEKFALYYLAWIRSAGVNYI